MLAMKKDMMINLAALRTRSLSGDETIVDLSHAWVTVPNPLNNQALLQACDYCGVVKSQNTLV